MPCMKAGALQLKYKACFPCSGWVQGTAPVLDRQPEPELLGRSFEPEQVQALGISASFQTHS